MRLALERCVAHGTRAGAHPSFPDREGFGRRPWSGPDDALRRALDTQCAALAREARALGTCIMHAKPHGALYHAVAHDPAVARATVAAVVAALGPVTIVGPPSGALRDAARAFGLPYAREGFADRATRPDGSLVPRAEPGALITDPSAVRERAKAIVAAGSVDTLCVHGDTPGAVALARAVRTALDALGSDGGPR
jgi:UPF0271 protein